MIGGKASTRHLLQSRSQKQPGGCYHEAAQTGFIVPRSGVCAFTMHSSGIKYCFPNIPRKSHWKIKWFTGHCSWKAEECKKFLGFDIKICCCAYEILTSTQPTTHFSLSRVQIVGSPWWNTACKCGLGQRGCWSACPQHITHVPCTSNSCKQMCKQSQREGHIQWGLLEQCEKLANETASCWEGTPGDLWFRYVTRDKRSHYAGGLKGNSPGQLILKRISRGVLS
jgi:hypothetical protein